MSPSDKPSAAPSAAGPVLASALEAARVVLRHELRRLAFSGRTLVFGAIYGGFGALSVAAFLWGASRARSEIDKRAGGPVSEADLERGTREIVGQVLGWLGWGDAGDAAEMFRDRVPLLGLYFFLLASYFLPLLVAMVSFDQFSELSTRAARYALLRVRRGSYFAGKAAAGAATVALLLALVWTCVGVAAAARGGPDALFDAVRETVRAWALMCVLALPYLSLTALVSAAVRPQFAFLGTFGLWIGLPLGAWIVDSVLPWMLRRQGWEAAGVQVRRLLVLFPWQHAPRLISRDVPTLLLHGVLPLCALAALGYLAAFALVRRRDV